MPSSISLGAISRGRFLFLLGIALILAGQRATDPMTAALFTSVATNTGNSISTATLNLAANPTGATVFSLTNMVPGDYYLNTVNIVNGSTSANQSFTYNVAAAASPTSLLDSHAPSATTSSGAAFLIFRCTSDAAQTTPVACSTASVYATQVYPTTGAGTQKQMGASGLTSAALGAVATGGAYTIPVNTQAYTGGQITFGAFNMGGPDAVSGADGQTKGLSGASPNHTDYLATLVYLPTQMDSTMAGLNSTITFTWTATQRAGKSLP